MNMLLHYLQTRRQRQTLNSLLNFIAQRQGESTRAFALLFAPQPGRTPVPARRTVTAIHHTDTLLNYEVEA